MSTCTKCSHSASCTAVLRLYGEGGTAVVFASTTGTRQYSTVPEVLCTTSTSLHVLVLYTVRYSWNTSKRVGRGEDRRSVQHGTIVVSYAGTVEWSAVHVLHYQSVHGRGGYVPATGTGSYSYCTS